MLIIEPHIHMYSRTTDDYAAMYREGIRACVEPSFWMGTNRRYAGTFFDYFQLILEFETLRARRFGIDHYAAVALNPKETEDRGLADDVLAGLPEYLDHPRCVALGEIGFNLMTPNEEYVFVRQLRLGIERNLPIIIHLPHTRKPDGIRRIAEILKAEGARVDRILIDHNTEETIRQSLDTGCFCGMTVYPISKLDPERVSEIIRQYGVSRMIVDGSADWGVSDPLSLVKTVSHMRARGHSEATVRTLVYDNPMAFYAHSPRWKPELDIQPLDPREFQR